MKLALVIPYLKKIQKIHESHDILLESCRHQYFLTENQQFLVYQGIQVQIEFSCINSRSFKFFWVFKGCFSKHGTLGLLKVKVVWNKAYEIITFVCDVTNKIFSSESNYIVDVVMWPKFDNSSISTRDVIITSIL